MTYSSRHSDRTSDRMADRAPDRTSDRMTDRTNDRTTERSNERCLPLSIHQISDYIKANAKFINQDHINDFSNMDSFDKRNNDQLITVLSKPGMTSELSDLPENLNQIFGGYNFKRLSVICDVSCPANCDVSFASAILNGAIDKYDTYKLKEKIDFTEKLIRKCLREYQTAFKNNHYDQLGWVSRDLRKTVSDFTINRELLRYFVDTLYVNLFILDIEKYCLNYVGYDPYIK